MGDTETSFLRKKRRKVQLVFRHCELTGQSSVWHEPPLRSLVRKDSRLMSFLAPIDGRMGKMLSYAR
jgi:hypothetical protein